MTERLDLNLLLVLDALMQEGSVTRAAAKLGLGQPATSAALNRLRGLYGDVLFVRTPQGMVPTARAREIAAGLSDTLETLRSTLTPSASFDPTTAKREFKICGGDFFGIVVLPGLVPSLMREAPGIDLRCRFIEKDDVLGCLEAGDIDLALTVLPDLPKYFATAPLLDDTFVCLTRPEHPAVASGLTREVFCGLDHILVTERGDATGAVDRALAPLGLTRRIAVTVPQVLVVPMLLAQTDLVATTGRRAAGAHHGDVPAACASRAGSSSRLAHGHGVVAAKRWGCRAGLASEPDRSRRPVGPGHRFLPAEAAFDISVRRF